MRTPLALALWLTLIVPTACGRDDSPAPDDATTDQTERLPPDTVLERATEVRRALRLYDRGPASDALRDPASWATVPAEVRAIADSPDARATVAAVIAEAEAESPEPGSVAVGSRMLRTMVLGQVTAFVAIADAHAGRGAHAAVALASVAILGGNRDDAAQGGAVTRARAARTLRQLVDAGLITAADLRAAAPVLARAESRRVSTARALRVFAAEDRVAARRGEIGIVDAATTASFHESLAAARTPLEQQVAIARCWQTRSLLDGYCTSLPRNMEKMRAQEASAGADLATVIARL